MLTSMAQRNDLRTGLSAARACTDALFSLVRADSFYERPIPERHRLIFYLGHLEAFDWNQICQGALALFPFHSEFDRLFAFGIDPPEGQLPSDVAWDWPRVSEVQSYNRRVRQTLDKVLDDAPEHLIHVAIEHRFMHAETLAYILHNLSYDRKLVQDEGTRVSPAAPAPVDAMKDIPAGTATLGKYRGDGFGWDNEFDAHTVDVPPFAISKYKVTNAQYLEFVRAGAAAPHFWKLDGDRWLYRTMFEEIPLPLDWPVYVTQREAQAYAAWVGKVVPTEAQFHRAAYGTPAGEERSYPWGNDFPDDTCGNFNFQGWDPVAVAATPLGDSTFGVSQLVGNGWEWTSTPFNPFPGFQPFPFYTGYSKPFFDGDHYVLKGASSRTAARLMRRSYRNWFRPGFPYAYAGFRCVEN